MEYIYYLIAYLIGSIPFGLVVGKFAKIGDIRTVGSGNIGATNMMRAGGKKLAALVLILDMLKGVVAVLLSQQFAENFAYMPQGIIAISALLVVAGHIFPIWLKFKGGKGVATALGAFLAINLYLGAGFIAVWLVVFYFSKTSSIAAVAAISASAIISYFQLDFIYFITIFAIASLVIYRHKENILRLIKGEEKGFK